MRELAAPLTRTIRSYSLVMLSLALLAGGACQSVAGPNRALQSDRPTPTATSAPTQNQTALQFDEQHQAFGRLLGTYVREGRVNYSGWLDNQGDRAALKAYVKWLAMADPEDLAEPAGKAFWINAYNAITLDSVLDRYPLTSVNFDELKDPKAKAFWDTPALVARQSLTLNDIESRILRPKFKDPRIHFAINCASNGCPALADSAYCSDLLDQQLDARTLAFLNDPFRGAQFDEQTGILRVSMIFQWYAADFGDATAFITKYRPQLAGKIKKLDYLPYDWRLNGVPSS